MKKPAPLLVLAGLIGCTPPPTPEAKAPTTPPPSASASAPPPTHPPAITFRSAGKAPWREPALLAPPRHPMATPQVVAIGKDAAIVRTLNLTVAVKAGGEVVGPLAIPPAATVALGKDGRVFFVHEDTPMMAASIDAAAAAGGFRPFGTGPSDPAVAPLLSLSRAPCATTLATDGSYRRGAAPEVLGGWAHLVDPTSLATLRAVPKSREGSACEVAQEARVRTAKAVDAGTPCSFAACVRGTTDPEPELTRTHVALLPGRCADADADATGACRESATAVREPQTVLADLEDRKALFMTPPPGCRPRRAVAVGGLALLVCEGATTTLWAAQPNGTWSGEGTLPIRPADVGTFALAADGTIVLRASWSDPAKRRAFVRAPHLAGDPAAWREISLGDALDVRVAPGGGALLLSAPEVDGKTLAVTLDAPTGRSPLAAKIALDAHLVDVSIERGKLVVWTLPSMHRGAPPAGTPAARGAATGSVVAVDGSLWPLPPDP
jgi:hypothetical protein